MIIRNDHAHFKGEISQSVENKLFVGFVWCGFGVFTVLFFTPYLCYEI